jgi:hypothetical protein
VTALNPVVSKWDDAVRTAETVYEFPRSALVTPSVSANRTTEGSPQAQLVGALADCFNKCLATIPLRRHESTSWAEMSRLRRLLASVSVLCREMTLGLQNEQHYSVDAWQIVASFFEWCARVIGSMERIGPGPACRASCLECSRNCRAMIHLATDI